MKELFHDKGGLMAKYLVNQIAFSIFGIMMALTASAIGDSWLLPFGVFGLLFYFFVLWTFVHEDGQKDAIRVEGGRATARPLYGLTYCAVAAVPAFILALLYIVTVSASAESAAMNTLSGILNIVTRLFTYGMYNGIDRYLALTVGGVFEMLSNSGISFIFYTVLSLIVCFFAYYTGLNAKPKKTK